MKPILTWSFVVEKKLTIASTDCQRPYPTQYHCNYWVGGHEGGSPPDRQPTITTAHHTTYCNLQSRSWWWANVCPKHVELILKINKYCYLLHLVGLGFITLLTLKMHGQTQIKFTICHADPHKLYFWASSCCHLIQTSDTLFQFSLTFATRSTNLLL
jgi:hypothetical protein